MKDKLRTAAPPICAAALVVLIPCIADAAAPDSGFALKRSAEAEATAKAAREAITSEALALSKDHWAGHYYGGDGLGVNQSLYLAPRAGFLFEWRGCLGLYDRNFGPVQVEETTAAVGNEATASAGEAGTAERTSSLIRLRFTLPNEEVGFRGIAGCLVPIRWGDRIYLASPDLPSTGQALQARAPNGILGFCNDVNSGAEPRTGMHGTTLLRKGDEKKPVTGKPAVPPAYRPYLLDAPVTATITAVSPTTERPGAGRIIFRDTPATLDQGRASGLLPGMIVYVQTTGHPAHRPTLSATVTSATEHQSDILFTRSGNHDPDPQPGWQLSTSPPWRRVNYTLPD